ncbi:MAG TPA: DUF2892 domain-containing protein [Rhodopila sp.]
MYVVRPDRVPARSAPLDEDRGRERRINLLVRRLPRRIQGGVHWLRRPGARWLRIPAGSLLIVGGVFSILPILGLWMLPLGVVLLAEDIPPLRSRTNRILEWIEHRRPHWMGLPRQSSSQFTPSSEETR